MNSEETLKEQNKKKTRVYLFIAGVFTALLVFFSLIFLIKIYKKKTLEKEYNAQVEQYNSIVERYNTKVDSYNDLVDELSERSVDVNSKRWRKLDSYNSDFLEFYTKKKNLDEISVQIDDVNKDLDELAKSYDEVRIEGYNACVEIYNVKITEYNDVIDRLSVFRDIGLPDKKDDVAKIEEKDLAGFQWDNGNDYIGTIDALLKRDEHSRNEEKQEFIDIFNILIENYTVLAEAYNQSIKGVAIQYIDGLSTYAGKMFPISSEYAETHNNEEVIDRIYRLVDDLEELAYEYTIVDQITCPEASWVKERLSRVSDIENIAFVTMGNDPNGLLDKEGGYTDCIYFSVKSVNQTSVKGSNTVERGTDGGGAIEVYDNLEYALNRCDYLAQFDGTLLYSGSYTVVGTMVIRTSYKLSNQEQVDLTDKIIQSFTEVDGEK